MLRELFLCGLLFQAGSIKTPPPFRGDGVFYIRLMHKHPGYFVRRNSMRLFS